MSMMKLLRALFVLACLFLFAGVAGATVRAAPHDENMETQTLRRTVAVIAPGQSASGVLISPNEVLMSAHLTQNEKRPVLIVTYDKEMIRGTVIWIDPALDLALVRIEKELPDYFPMRMTPVRIGESVRTIGQPDATPWAVSTGVVIEPDKKVIVNSGREIKQYALIVSSAQTKKGGSGGALVDEEGNLVGIVVASVNVSANSATQSIASFCEAYRHSFCR